jgi:HSP20 family protein
MSGTSLQQRAANQPVSPRQDYSDPLVPLRRQMGRLFDDFFSSPMFPPLPMVPPAQTLAAMVMAPRLEVSETEKELHITAELPGIDPKDAEVTLADDVLTIRGEKQAQHEEGKERDFHLTERSYGTFARHLRLPFHADAQKIQASFKDGVLTLTIPKPEEAQQKVHRIDVAVEAPPSQAEGSQQAGGAPAQQQQAAAAE